MRTSCRAEANWLAVIALGTIMIASAFGACSLIVGPMPADAEPFDPPAVFTRWWAMMEACSGHSGDMAAVRWYRVPGSSFIHDGQSVGGFWRTPGNRIVLAEGGIDNGTLVRHEMLHALLQKLTHTRAHFFEACAPLVTCSKGCVGAEPWSPPTEDYVILPPDSLEIDSEAELLLPEADGERWLALTVTVRNTRGHAVVVASSGDARRPWTFSFHLQGPEGGLSTEYQADDSSRLFFQPYETKRWLYEFRVDSALTMYTVTTGSHLVRGGYARRWAGYDTVIVSR